MPISREGAIFSLECILIADDQESMLIYNQDGNRMAVIITLPFITCVQSRLFSEMIEHASELAREGKEPAGDGTKDWKKKSSKVNQRSRERTMTDSTEGAILQRDGKTYAVATRIPAGMVTPAQTRNNCQGRAEIPCAGPETHDRA